MKTRITASELEKHILCPGYKYLDKEDYDNASMSDGRKIHKMIEDYLRRGNVEVGDSQHPKYKSFLSFFDEYKTKMRVLAVEQAYAYDIFTGESKEIAITDRDYPYDAGFVYGTADLVCSVNGEKYVIDWKTGKNHDASYVYQMAMLKLMSGAERCMIVYLSEDGYTKRLFWQDEIEQATEEIMVALANDEIVFRRNHHCLDCRAVGCPMSRAIANIICGDSIATPEDAWRALMREKQLKEEAEKLSSAVKAYCESQSGYVSLPDGHAYVMRCETRRTLDQEAAKSLIVQCGYNVSDYEKETKFKKFMLLTKNKEKKNV